MPGQFRARYDGVRQPRTAERLMADIGRRVAELRRARGWTQLECATRLGVSSGYLKRIEAGEQNLTLVSVARLAGCVGVDALALFEPPRNGSLRRPGRPRRH
jgi:transcriptional regulator with XRE-family HTH domain